MSTITKADIVAKIRTAIDDIVPSAADSFTNDTNAELWQAAYEAVCGLLEELPIRLLTPSSGTSASVSNVDGGTVITLPSGFLRFVNVRLSGWTGELSELMEPDSDEAKRQRCTWCRGTIHKPKAMLDFNASGAQVLHCWPSGTISILNYIPKATKNVADDQITSAIRDEAERLIVFRAASIFFEGKKESEIAGKFREMSNVI